MRRACPGDRRVPRDERVAVSVLRAGRGDVAPPPGRSSADATFLWDIIDGAGCEIYTLETLRASHERGASKHRSELCSLYVREHPDEFSVLRIDAPAELAPQGRAPDRGLPGRPGGLPRRLPGATGAGAAHQRAGHRALPRRAPRVCSSCIAPYTEAGYATMDLWGKPLCRTVDHELQQVEGVLVADSRPHPGRRAHLLEGRRSVSGTGAGRHRVRAVARTSWDVDGNEYLDCSMGLTSVSLGHAYAPVLERVKAELDRGVELSAAVGAGARDGRDGSCRSCRSTTWSSSRRTDPP